MKNIFLLFFIYSIILLGCRNDDDEKTQEQVSVAVVLSVVEKDGGFNEFTLKGARQAAENFDLDFTYLVSFPNQFEFDIKKLADDGYDLIIGLGFLMTDALSNAATAYPDTHFAIMDVVYDSYDDLLNVTSLAFAEDQVGYLAGALAGCVTETFVIGTVAGMEIPPVIRFVTGFQKGALSVNPSVVLLNEYIPSFNDPMMGRQVGEAHIAQGADVIFAVAGETGNGALEAAHQADIKAIGVDVDQYYTFPQVARSLITSAMKKVDIVAYDAVRDFVAGKRGIVIRGAASTLESGIRLATVANGGVGLAPYHDWENKISEQCKQKVINARQRIAIDPVKK
jgi:basic membrane protein A